MTVVSEWKSEERVRWLQEADQFLLEQIKIHTMESHMDLARKIISHPLLEGRSLGAIEQRIGWMRAKVRNNCAQSASTDDGSTNEKVAVNGLAQHIKSVLMDIWRNEIAIDYSRHFLLKEDTLKNAIYYHLRQNLGNEYLIRHHLGIFTEYTVGDQRIDLVVARVDVNKAKTRHLQYCVEQIIIAMELKYRSNSIDTGFKNDVRKVVDFLRSPDFDDSHFFLGFIQEVSFDKPEGFTWLTAQQQKQATGRVTELIQFRDEKSGLPIWDVVEH